MNSQRGATRLWRETNTAGDEYQSLRRRYPLFCGEVKLNLGQPKIAVLSLYSSWFVL
jgi:hypothetical protein